MQTAWLKGLKGQDKEKRKAEVMNYRNAFEALKEILERDYKKKQSVRDYEAPNWELRQIAANEYNQALDDLLKLITLDKE
jgi:isopropylmalate/homocitrate/citramalate synthase